MLTLILAAVLCACVECCYNVHWAIRPVPIQGLLIHFMSAQYTGPIVATCNRQRYGVPLSDQYWHGTWVPCPLVAITNPMNPLYRADTTMFTGLTACIFMMYAGRGVLIMLVLFVWGKGTFIL